MRSLLSLAIRTQILLIAMIMAVPTAGTIIYSSNHIQKEEINKAVIDTQRLTTAIAAEQQNIIAVAQQVISMLAMLPDVKNQNAKKVQPILRDALKLEPHFSNIFIASRKGIVWATAVPGVTNVADRRYFKSALENDRLASGEYVISRAISMPVINIAAPIKNAGGATIGVISVGLKIDVYQQVLERAMLPSGAHITLLDHKGVILYRSLDTAELIGKKFDETLFKTMQKGPDTATFDNMRAMQGDNRVLTYRKLWLPGEQSPYMYIRAGIPVSTVLENARKALIQNLLILILFLVAAILLALYIGKRSIIDRVTLLEKATRAVTDGNLKVRVTDLVAGGELGRLGQTFDEMASQLALREQALVKSEKNYREIFNATKDGIFVHDAESGGILDVNNAVETMYGYSRTEMLHQEGRPLGFAPPPYSLKEAIQWIQKTVQEGPQSFEWLARRKNGELFWTEIVLSATNIGGSGRVLAVVRDIAARKKAEEDRQKLVSVIEMSRDFIGIADLNGRVLYLNAAALNLVGLDDIEKVRGKFINTLHMKADHQQLETEILPAAFRMGSWVGELSLRHFETGLPIPVDMNVFSISDSKTERPIALACIGRDITERKHAEEEKAKLQSQVMHIQKMESIGQLSGGIAHDFNNILTAIIGYGNLMRMTLGKTDPGQTHLDHILTSAERATKLTGSLLAFSRKQTINPRIVNLNDVIHEIERFLSRIISEDITLCTTLSSTALSVFVDPMQVEQILMNLSTNARDAMPNGGRLLIQTSRMKIKEDNAAAPAFIKRGTYAVLTVTDNGTGIDAALKEKIFDPFYTTKAVGKGTGLGLSIVYGIVKQNNGYITVQSELNAGAQFTIYLPLINACQDTTSLGTSVLAETPSRGGCETILLAEDNDPVRKLTQTILHQHGYDVVEAVDGVDALTKFRENKDRIHLMMIDVIMPGKNGRQVYDEVRAMKPDMKVIFTSGYPADLIQKEGVLEKGFQFLPKPSKPRDIINKVRSVLDA